MGGEDYVVDSACAARFESNAGSRTVIASPDHFERVLYNAGSGGGNNGYPTNMNLETSCHLSMDNGCFANDSQEKGLEANKDTTTDVCRHDLAAYPQSNHIKGGRASSQGRRPPCTAWDSLGRTARRSCWVT